MSTALTKVHHTKHRLNLDGVGFIASLLCAIHCVAMPFAISFLPLLGWELLANPAIETGITFFSMCISVSSFIPSYKKSHHNWSPILLLIIGLSIIFCTHLFGPEELEFIFIPIGGVLISLAHYINWKLIKRHRYSCCDDN